MILKLIVAD